MALCAGFLGLGGTIFLYLKTVVVNIFKKLAIILVSLIVVTSPLLIFIAPKETHAIGVVGSNAVKSVVIGSMERAGVQFTSKAAKDKAFDAWNMKAYEKWKADEAAGRNQDLWDAWKAFESNPQKYGKIEPIPDKPGYGKMIIESSIFGMAALIGWEIGGAIYDAATANPPQDLTYITDQYELMAQYGFSTDQFGIRIYKGNEIPGSDWLQYTYNLEYAGLKDTLNSGTVITSRITKREVIGNNVAYTISYVQDFHKRVSGYSHSGTGSKKIYIPLNKDVMPEVFEYKAKPLPEHIPTRSPVPELQPLYAPNPDLAVIPEVLPPAVPVEVIVPLYPESDPFWDDTINEPYAPPEPGKEPGKEPGTNPGTTPGATPGQDPNKKPLPGTVPEPGAIKDPFEKPKEIKEENLSCERVQRPDFEPLGNAFTTSFPFSLPWDLKRYLDASFSGIGSEKPKFDLPFFGDDVEITIPDELDKYIKFFKGFLLIVFDLSIIYLFVRVMRGGSD